MKRFIIGGLAALAIGVGTLAGTGTANAFPGFCPGGGGGYGAFGYCDGPSYPDGSYDHTVMIFGRVARGNRTPGLPQIPA
jgi:hypothetical protein